jgi:hypothetical protein
LERKLKKFEFFSKWITSRIASWIAMQFTHFYCIVSNFCWILIWKIILDFK